MNYKFSSIMSMWINVCNFEQIDFNWWLFNSTLDKVYKAEIEKYLKFDLEYEI